MKHVLLQYPRRERMVAWLAIVACAVPFACRAGDVDIAVKDPAAVVKPLVQAPDRKPILFIDISIRKKEKREALVAAWEAGLGRPSDIVSSIGDDYRDEIAKIKLGEHAWMGEKAGQLAAWARTADKTDKNLRWLWYNIEGGTPQFERAHAYKAAEDLHDMCAQHGWKFGIITDEALPRLMAYAPRCDALIFECQKSQDQPTARKMRGLAAKLREVNPKCLFGIQLGVGVPQKGYGGTEGAIMFYKATQDFVDLYSVWWGTPETMIEFLKKVGSRNPQKPLDIQHRE